MADTTPAHLFVPDSGPDIDFPSDEHRRVLARCNLGYPIGFSELHDRLAADPFTYGIGVSDQMKLAQILGELVASGDCIQRGDGTFESTAQGWEKVTHNGGDA
jgi:hypothetical protein